MTTTKTAQRDAQFAQEVLTTKVLRQVERRLTRIAGRRAKPAMRAAYKEAVKRVRRLTH